MMALSWHTACVFIEKWFAISPGWPEEKLIEKLLNSHLKKELANGEFDFLCCHRVGIESRYPCYAIEIELKNEKLRVHKSQSNLSGCDVLIRGEVLDFLEILLGNADPDTLFFQRRIVVEGNMEVALRIKNRLDAIEVERISPWHRKILTSALRIIQPESVRG